MFAPRNSMLRITGVIGLIFTQQAMSAARMPLTPSVMSICGVSKAKVSAGVVSIILAIIERSMMMP